MKEKLKIEVISTIDKLQNYFNSSIYKKELKMLRLKYIYKDISNGELLNDIKYLKNLHSITRTPFYKSKVNNGK
jgi:hypothetical protein